MDREVQFRHFFRLTSTLTDLFPNGAAGLLDASVRRLLGNRLVLQALIRQAENRIAGANGFRRFLVAADLNIGDAVIAEGGITALREIFPDAIIDFVVKKSTGDLFEGNPDIELLHAVYLGAPFPSDDDLLELSRIAAGKEYDLVINFSPMIPDKVFGNKPVINYSLMAAELIRNEGSAESVNNVVLQAHKLVRKVFGDHGVPDYSSRFSGARIYLSDEAVQAASDFLIKSGALPGRRLVMFNPDASAKFTRMPFAFQVDLLKKIAALDVTILLGAGHVEKFIEDKLVGSMTTEQGRAIVIVPPSTPLDVYAAMIDMSEVYISGDTGPLHLASARKYLRDSGRSLRNRTSVIAIFGGTPPRIYGYDSSSPGFFPANQDAPSKTFVAKSPCRNITCINKMAKTCKEVRCFDGLDPDAVVSEIAARIEAAGSLPHGERLQILAE